MRGEFSSLGTARGASGNVVRFQFVPMVGVIFDDDERQLAE